MNTLKTSIGTFEITRNCYGEKFGRCENFTVQSTPDGRVLVKANFEPTGERNICSEAVVIWHSYSRRYMNAWASIVKIDTATELELKKMIQFYEAN